MNRLLIPVTLLLFLLTYGLYSYLSQPSFTAPGILSIEPYIPEEYELLPPALIGSIEKADYEKCAKALPNSGSEFFRITYLSQGLKVVGYLGMPKKQSPNQKRPVTVYVRGGNRDFGRIYACTLLLADDFFGSMNHIILAPQFRGVEGGEGKDEFGGADIHDLLEIIKIAKALPNADPENTFLAGWSRGGMMVYMALKRQSAIRAAAILAGPTDLELSARDRPEMAMLFSELIPRFHEDRENTLRDRSAVSWAGKINAPLVIFHGTKDKRVSYRHAELIEAELKKHQKTFKLVTFQDEGHGLENVRAELKNQMQEWFSKYTAK